jgi:hypothetical protein
VESTGQTSNVTVVVDPNYGHNIETAAQTAPVWAVASLVNKSACERIWAAHRTLDHRKRGAVTLYEIVDQEDRLGNLLAVFPTLETHHGKIGDDYCFSLPSGFVLGVRGLAPTETVTSALKELGFSTFAGLADGFTASK